MKKQRKRSTNVLAGTLAVLLGVTGTFAWQSISQEALNVKAGYSNPGGRLHDDFNGTNKDVYVENFTTVADNGEEIYARVRLREYMEYGEGAGQSLHEEDRQDITSINSGAKSNDKSTWHTYLWEETSTDNEIRKYFTLNFGGETIYMPTFNKNKDSLSADINGTYEGTDGTYAGTDNIDVTIEENANYTDYKEYEDGEMSEETNAYYDADDNDVAEPETEGLGDTGTEDVNHTVTPETHQAKTTLNAEVISMETWKTEKNSEPGPYWVYDTDGWAYWAQAIEPETATGLLLDEVVKERTIAGKWYYAIDVQGQFVTADDMGTGTAGAADPSGTGFYTDGFTTEAKGMMDKIIAAEALQAEAEAVLGTTDTIRIDGIDWYVLAVEGRQAMVWAKDPVEEIGERQFHNDDTITQKWENSDLKTYLNETWLPTKTELNTKAVAKSFKTREGYNLQTFVESTDSRVFLLSEADVSGKFGGSEEAKPEDYTYQGKQLVTNPELLKADITIADAYWLRSPRDNASFVSYVSGSTGSVRGSGVTNTVVGVRPALWLNLAS